jgi:hypothetical protein
VVSIMQSMRVVLLRLAMPTIDYILNVRFSRIMCIMPDVSRVGVVGSIPVVTVGGVVSIVGSTPDRNFSPNFEVEITKSGSSGLPTADSIPRAACEGFHILPLMTSLLMTLSL